MIDRRLSSDFRAEKEREWFFPTFDIQEYLLPQINVGKSRIDEYGDTTFTSDDCARLMGNIEYLIDSGIFDKKREITFDSFDKGLVTLPCAQVKGCLLKLYEAADLAVERHGLLVFCGD